MTTKTKLEPIYLTDGNVHHFYSERPVKEAPCVDKYSPKAVRIDSLVERLNEIRIVAGDTPVALEVKNVIDELNEIAEG